MKKIVVTGATGYLGKKIAAKLIERGDEIYILTRSPENAKKMIPHAKNFIEWNPNSNSWYAFLEDKDAVINLAGENVMAHRWNNNHKQKILSSRIDTTRSLIAAFESIKHKPKVFVSASAIGYYGNREKLVDENSEPGQDFLAQVVAQWENETKKTDFLSLRRVNIRIGIVLDKEEGALAKMIFPFKFFIGGLLGSGTQWFSWVHVDDVVGIFLYAVDNELVNGILNAVSPNPVRMNEFCKTLGKVMKRPVLFKVPAIALKIIFGEAAQVILEGAKVYPNRTLETGYRFQYENIESALKIFFPQTPNNIRSS